MSDTSRAAWAIPARVWKIRPRTVVHVCVVAQTGPPATNTLSIDMDSTVDPDVECMHPLVGRGAKGDRYMSIGTILLIVLLTSR